MAFKRPEILNYNECVRFHGHNGPFLALGYKLGFFLNRTLKPKGIMDFIITVQVKQAKPFTCIVDGLQCSTFATYGKGTIAIQQGRSRGIRVIVRKGQKKYGYAATRQAWHVCTQCADLDRGAAKILRMPLHELWTKKHMTTPYLKHKRRIH